MDDNDDSGMDDDGDDGDVPGDDNAMDEENGLGDDDDDNSSSTGEGHGGVQYGSITLPLGVKRYGMVEVERLSDLVDSAVAHARSCGGELTKNNKTDSVVAEVALSCSCGHNYDWCGSGVGEGSIPNVLNLACLSTPDVELTAMNNLFRAMGAGRVSSAHAGVKAGAAMERAVNGVDRELELETLAAVKASPHSTRLLVDGAASSCAQNQANMLATTVKLKNGPTVSSVALSHSPTGHSVSPGPLSFDEGLHDMKYRR